MMRHKPSAFMRQSKPLSRALKAMITSHTISSSLWPRGPYHINHENSTFLAWQRLWLWPLAVDLSKLKKNGGAAGNLTQPLFKKRSSNRGMAPEVSTQQSAAHHPQRLALSERPRPLYRWCPEAPTEGA